MNRRNATITAGAVTGMVLAGTLAIAANTSILNAADDDNVGELSAAAVVNAAPVDPEPQIIEVYIDDPAPAPAPVTTIPPTSTGAPLAAADEPPSQVFTVDAAGTVEVAETEAGIALGKVSTNQGWAWELTTASETSLIVTFRSGDTEFVFFADVVDDGSIAARVEQPIVRVVQAPSASAAVHSGGVAPPDENVQYDDDRDDDRDDDEDERDDENERDDEDERDDDGRDDHDDDHDDEREGGDDDD